MNLTDERQMIAQIVIMVVLSILLVMTLGVPVCAQTEIASDTPAQQELRVSISPGQSIQDAVDANPAGTTFHIKAGIHRLQQVKPKDGDKFIGESGAILSGAKVLSAQDFVKSDNYWYIEGQTQRLSQPFGTDIIIPGYESDLNPEELFVNGDMRLKRVGDLSELGTKRWYFDYKTARIYLYDDPSSFSLIETSAASAAFGGSGIKNVLIDNLVIEKYGNPPNHGAVGSLGTPDSRFTYSGFTNYGGRWWVVHPYSETGKRPARSPWDREKKTFTSQLVGLDSVQHIRDYFITRNIELSDFEPDHGLGVDLDGRTGIQSPKVMRRGTDEYLIYHPNASSDGKETGTDASRKARFCLNLQIAHGLFSVEWYRAEDGITYDGGIIEGGKEIEFASPWVGHDVVIHLVKIPDTKN